MNRRQENYVSMVDSTLGVLTPNTSIWMGSAPFAAAVDSVMVARQAIAKAVQGQQANTVGVSEDKEELADAAIAHAVRIAKLVQAYALDMDDDGLFRQMQLNATMLDRMSDTELPEALRDVHARVTALGSSTLMGYGVTPTMLTALMQAITAYEAEAQSPRIMISERKTQTAIIPQQLKVIRLAFAKLDRLVRMHEVAHPTFVSNYRNARIVVDLRGPGDEEGEDPSA